MLDGAFFIVTLKTVAYVHHTRESWHCVHFLDFVYVKNCILKLSHPRKNGLPDRQSVSGTRRQTLKIYLACALCNAILMHQGNLQEQILQKRLLYKSKHHRHQQQHGSTSLLYLPIRFLQWYQIWRQWLPTHQH